MPVKISLSSPLLFVILSACTGFTSTPATQLTTTGPLICPAPATVTPGQLQLLAGQIGGPGYLDAPIASARFVGPSGSVFDSSGNLFVVDAGNELIRKIDLSGMVTTFAGQYGTQGSADGASTSAQFKQPSGIAIDSAGNLFVADSGNSTIRKITPAGMVSTFAGQAGSSGTTDGTGSAARFMVPNAIAIDSTNNLYVVDVTAHTVRQISTTGVVTTLAGSPGVTGSADGVGSAARFNRPSGIAIDGAGNLYVADAVNDTIRKIASGGVVSTIAGSPGVSGFADGAGGAARFNAPIGIVSDAAGRLSVIDTYNFTIRQISTGGVVTTLAGSVGVHGNADGVGSAATFYNSRALSQDIDGNLYVSDGSGSGGSAIRKITSGGIVTTFAGSVEHPGILNGVGAQAQFTSPLGLVVDSCGNIFATDSIADVIRKVAPDGTATIFAGTVGVSGSSDGLSTTALFHGPAGLGIDGNNVLYVADTGNHTIRRITPQGIVTTLAGSAGSSGHVDAVGSAARFNTPTRLTADASGTVFVLDSSNTVRKVAPDGTVSTLAGSGSVGSADGTGSAATFNFPQGIAVGPGGTVYITDTYNFTIRQITAAGVVTTLAGGSGYVNGPIASARFAYPVGIAVDALGTIYVSELFSDVRKISAGVVSTVIGNPPQNGVSFGPLPASMGSSGNGGPLAVTSSRLFLASENAILQCQKP